MDVKRVPVSNFQRSQIWVIVQPSPHIISPPKATSMRAVLSIFFPRLHDSGLLMIHTVPNLVFFSKKRSTLVGTCGRLIWFTRCRKAGWNILFRSLMLKLLHSHRNAFRYIIMFALVRDVGGALLGNISLRPSPKYFPEASASQL